MPTIFDSKTSMKRIYDRYYHSNYYNHRYPLYNENSLSIILKTINSEKTYNFRLWMWKWKIYFSFIETN